jgi:hypothetical protein
MTPAPHAHQPAPRSDLHARRLPWPLTRDPVADAAASVPRSGWASPGPALVALLALGTLAACGGSDEDPPPQVVQAAAANAAGLQPSVDAFRDRLGPNNGSAAAASGGRREVNWDGIPTASLDPFPGGFFATNSPRGLVFSTPGSRMKVSGDPGTDAFLFADVTAKLPNGQPWGPIEFGTFSASRFFATMDSNITDVTFVVPGTQVPATVSAFGVVLVDVDVADGTRLEFYGADERLLYRHVVPVAGAVSKGLSFVGVQLPRPAARVRIVAGTHPVNAVFQNPPPDGVGIDDVIVAEPVAR